MKVKSLTHSFNHFVFYQQIVVAKYRPICQVSMQESLCQNTENSLSTSSTVNSSLSTNNNTTDPKFVSTEQQPLTNQNQTQSTVTKTTQKSHSGSDSLLNLPNMPNMPPGTEISVLDFGLFSFRCNCLLFQDWKCGRTNNWKTFSKV
jgi:hypothetical protein